MREPKVINMDQVEPARVRARGTANLDQDAEAFEVLLGLFELVHVPARSAILK
jgi:hypothetical protein